MAKTIIEDKRFTKFRNFMYQKRMALGMSQTDLAKAIRRSENDKVDRFFINKIENGKKGITFETMTRILDALDSDISFTEN
ncbi:MAG: helix-turn-helix transcriptional regulator [Bacteroidetes bacterium]|nr:helix-turn-helix transcriptional regulator [Bacteroidota bacterium]